MLRKSYFIILTSCFLASCSVKKQIAKSANENVLSAPALQTAHVGISIYEPATNKYWYNYQGDKYFVPASNTKIPTCYAAMKYLGDSLVGLRYGIPEEQFLKDNTIVIQPTGDPTFLLSEYINHPVFEFLNQKFKIEKKRAGIYYDGSNVERWGSGWSWNDYDESYMAERSIFPVFGNVITIRLEELQNRIIKDVTEIKRVVSLFKTESHYFDTLLNQRLALISVENASSALPKLKITRNISQNEFHVWPDKNAFSNKAFPFVTATTATVKDILSDTLKTKFTYVFKAGANNTYDWACEDCDVSFITINKWNNLHSQPTDSLLKPMMHRSDNFFAEQSLLMVSNERLGIMNDEKIIDTLLKTDFKDLPQKPRWVDGSGLSRYNLFTPQDFVAILNKMKNEFGMERIKVILPTGGEGTLGSYYNKESGYIYAKTGTLSGVVAISGFLYTKKNKLLIFSVLVNNHNNSATDVRRAVEKFIAGIRNKY
jgi:D-alanyl-D-alanine carboxypeptidase/D-alanyl-D-alanine-endopeptidase (penicillin-binding protein 4)